MINGFCTPCTAPLGAINYNVFFQVNGEDLYSVDRKKNIKITPCLKFLSDSHVCYGIISINTNSNDMRSHFVFTLY